MSFPKRGQAYRNGHFSGKRKGNEGVNPGNKYEQIEQTFDDQEAGPSTQPEQAPNKKIRHPPGLRGKEIGLFYKNLSMERRKKEGKVRKGKKELTHQMTLDIKVNLEKEKIIQNLINSILPKIIPFSNMNLNSLENYGNMEESLFKEKYLQNIQGSISSKLERIVNYFEDKPVLNEFFKEELMNKMQSDKYKKLLEFRKKLPSFEKEKEILSMIEKHQVMLISGETGCGKTTQVAQFILDDKIMKGRASCCYIVCTQPRRISTISVAERVAEERGEVLGHSVGYQIRLDYRMPRTYASILFCTTGILIQQMQTDPALSRVSHLILDEIHERDVLSDFILAILKDVLPKRPNLKLILMSATLNAERFSQYFDNCPTLNIPGFTFPVQEYYLEDVLQMTGYCPDYLKSAGNSRGHKRGKKQKKEFEEMIDPYIRKLSKENKYSRKVLDVIQQPESEDLDIVLISNLVHYICVKEREGAILIFLPGWTDISDLHNKLIQKPFFANDRFIIIPLHSLMPTLSQKSVFDRPPEGVRKIIISTSIAETSVTIDDVVFVINCGKTKISNFDVANNISTLQPEWVSLANSRQRRGRAGRTRPGICYHLYTRQRETKLDEYLLPEILRKRLEEVIMSGKILQVGKIEPFLNKVMDPPDPRAVELSLELLKTMEILDSEENLTPLGYHLAKLPLDPHTAKMILMGALFSCVDPVFSVAASLSFKNPFFAPLNKEEEVNQRKRELSQGGKSDHLLLIEVLTYWENAHSMGMARKFARDYFLSYQTLSSLSEMKKQFAQYLHEMKFLKDSDPKHRDANLNSHNKSLVKAIISSGLYPNLAYVHWVKRTKNLRIKSKITTKEDGRVYLHPKSINFETDYFESPLILYHQKLKSSQIFLHDTTMIYPLQLLFFGSHLEFEKNPVEKGKGFLSIGNIQFQCRVSTASLIMDLKKCMDWLLEKKIKNPGHINWYLDNEEIKILRAIDQLIASEDCQPMFTNSDGGSDSEDD